MAEEASVAQDIARLRKSRGTYKGHFTKTCAKLATTDTLTTQDIDYGVMDTMLESVRHTVECLEKIHEDLVEVDPSHEREHNLELTKSQDEAETLLDTITLRSQKGHACHELEAILKFLNAFQLTEESAPQQVTKQIQHRDELFVTAQGRYRRAVRSDPYLQGLVDAITLKMSDINSRLPEIAVAEGPAARHLRYDRGSSDKESSHKHRKLPHIETPKFTGDILEWNDFWTVFRRNVHNNTELDEDEKLSYLQMSIKDKGQANLSDMMAGSYAACIASLKAKYEQPRLIYEHYAKMFFNYPQCKEDTTQALTKLHSTLSQARKRLNETRVMTLDEAMSVYAEWLLPPNAWKEWSRLHTDPTVIPDIDDLLKFIELQAKLCGRDVTQISIKPNERQERQERQERPRYDRNRRERNTSSSRDERPTREVFAATTNQQCLFCKGTDHSVYGCPKFKGLSVEDRSQFATTAKLCYNCLCPSHDKRACKSTYTCKRCNKSHHTLLHRERPPIRTDHAETATVQRTSNAVSLEMATDAVLMDGETLIIEDTVSPTLSLTAQSPSGQETGVTTLYDPGAQLSLITNRVANQLGLVRRACNVRVIQALGSGMVSASAVVLNLSSHHVPGESRELVAVVVPKIGGTSNPPLDQRWTFLDHLQLADPHFRQRRRVDVILGQNVTRHVIKAGLEEGPVDSIWAQNTIWGWMVQGQVGRPQRLLEKETTATCSHLATSICTTALTRMQADSEGNELLRQFFESEAVEEEPTHSMEDQQAMEHFAKTHKTLPDGRMQVSLPRRQDMKELGTSRGAALRRYLSNERTLTRRKALQPFQEVMFEYFQLNHAEVIPQGEVTTLPTEHYYMPLHAVVKETSTTTKLRIVFDASASSSNGVSLNDTLLTGPTVHPPLTEILMRFRSHRIGMTADISKMYREIALDPTNRDLHRFLWRSKPDEPISDCRMKRVTFGVSSSPFLATQIIQQIADNIESTHPIAAHALHREFYVDDFISGADTIDQAITIQREVYNVLKTHKLTLRKWRSSSQEVLQAISPDLQEKETITRPYGRRHYLKTLGIQWDAGRDDFYVSTSDLTLPKTITKRALTSDVARTFDVMGWYAPATLTMKSLIQKLWAAGKDWDEPVPPEIQMEWKQWREELPLLASQPIPRAYFIYTQGERVDVSLHGFSDASLKGYAAVVYVRSTYHHGPPCIQLIQAKTKVAPLKGLTVPRLELCGAQLLSGLITTIRTALGIPLRRIQCWTDSQIVRYWLDGKSRPHKTYVANRIRRTLEGVPPNHWLHVPGKDNPADCASRGITPGALQAHSLWWHGPDWLAQDPVAVPPQPHLSHLEKSTEELVKVRTASAITISQSIIEERYSSYACLRRTVAWILRFVRNCKPKSTSRQPHRRLTVKDIEEAEALLYKRAQRRMMQGTNLASWQRDKSIRALNPTKDLHGIYRVNGRLKNSPLAHAQRHPIIMDGKDVLMKKIIVYHHFRGEHAGPTLLMSMVGRNHYVLRGLTTCKAIVRNCVECTRTRLTTQQQMMGQLPTARVTPSRPFSQVGTDFAGPVTLRKGHTRKPVYIKGYVCVFVCLATKATHLEVVSSLSTEAFMDSLTRFTSRRGIPVCIHSDNGSNYVGASKELEEIYQLLRKEQTQQSVTKFCVEHKIRWKFNPARAPHFGGLWEAAVKSFKLHFRRLVKTTVLTYEGITTLLCRIEAALNSRPLMPITTHSEEGVDFLTPGHFLVGQPLNALPEIEIQQDRNPRSHFIQLRQLAQRFWTRWSDDYLAQLQRRTKWQKPQINVKVGDVVLIRGEATFHQNTWPMARVIETFAGKDGLVRTVDLQIGTKIFRRPIAKLTILVSTGSRINDVPLPPAGMSESRDSESGED